MVLTGMLSETMATENNGGLRLKWPNNNEPIIGPTMGQRTWANNGSKMSLRSTNKTNNMAND